MFVVDKLTLTDLKLSFRNFVRDQNNGIINKESELRLWLAFWKHLHLKCHIVSEIRRKHGRNVETPSNQ